MGLITQQRGGGSNVPAGEKLRFTVRTAKFVEGEYGPQAEMELEVLAGEHKGAILREWASFFQPRTNFVRNLRNKFYSDEDIATILEREGYEFDEIDEPEDEVKVGQSGKLINICMAAFRGDTEVIDGFDSVDSLLAALEGQSFESITKTRGSEGKHTGITWDMVYVDSDASSEAAEEDRVARSKETEARSRTFSREAQALNDAESEELPDFGDDPAPAF